MRFSTLGRAGLLIALALFAGCRKSASDTAAIKVDLTFAPSPPTVGKISATLTLAGKNNQPLSNVEVRLEGNMNHAGMKPSFADLSEEAPGRYVGTLDFTMGGDWFVLVTARLPDGGRLERKIDVLGVQAR